MKLVTLTRWAELTFEDPPSAATLRMWARCGRFDPPAQKVGRSYYVSSSARYFEPPPPEFIPDDDSLMSRIIRARAGIHRRPSRKKKPAS
ncbi:MAG TPA: excisionase [Rhodospirillaceae bacterium]|nr:excisionase [Rhodospirillaceae bacterium]